MQTNYPFEDKTALTHKPETKEQSAEELIYKHDIKLQELSIRMDHVENKLNKIMNKYNLYWEVIEDDK